MKTHSAFRHFFQVFDSVPLSCRLESFVDPNIFRRTSILEAGVLTYFSRRLSHELGLSPSPAVVFPNGAPDLWDRRAIPYWQAGTPDTNFRPLPHRTKARKERSFQKKEEIRNDCLARYCALLYRFFGCAS